MNFKRSFLTFVLMLFFCAQIFCISPIFPPKEIEILKKSYPDIKFSYKYDSKVKDWKIILKIPYYDEDTVFYWSEGRMLPEEELFNAQKYWPIIYKISELEDPANMTEQQKNQLKKFSSTENRKSGAGTPMFFFDAVYDSKTRASLEKRIKRINFLGKNTTVHEKIVAPLKKVDEKILKLSESDSEVKEFLENLKSADAYYWRIISGTNRKSFHSLGIALDVLPYKYGGKEVFWSWAKDKNPDGWMFTPLSKRWMPPEQVIKIFEENGFIWGGDWAIWDNMHFEYHPELILYKAAKFINIF